LSNESTSKFKLTFSLKQQTPMIHFQYDQEGATLRATEVKPKLDRFIIDYVKGKIDIPNSWYIDRTKVDKNKYGALKYKMKIEVLKNNEEMKYIKSNETVYKIFEKGLSTSDDKKEVKRAIPKSYFGNLVKLDETASREDKRETIKESFKEYIIYKDSIILTIFSFSEGKISIPSLFENKELTLLDLIEILIPVFFEVTNFGTRQSKGFGSFIVENNFDNKITIKDIYPIYFFIDYSKIQNKTYHEENFEHKKDCFEALHDIKNIYSLMRSGLNYTDGDKNKDNYVKGFSLLYKKESFYNDKLFIKSEVLNIIDNKNIDKKKYRLVRGMLGLASTTIFSKKDKKTYIPKNENKIKIVDSGFEKKEDKITRFSSPITFKVNENEGNVILYIFPNIINKKMFNRKFTINGKPIWTPKKEEFNLIDFLDKFMIYFNDETTKNTLSKFNENTEGADITFKKGLVIERFPQKRGEKF